MNNPCCLGSVRFQMTRSPHLGNYDWILAIWFLCIGQPPAASESPCLPCRWDRVGAGPAPLAATGRRKVGGLRIN